MKLSLQDILDVAYEETENIVNCFYKFRMENKSCNCCDSKGFCEKLKERLEEAEEEA